jgi:hypothetical protein
MTVLKRQRKPRLKDAYSRFRPEHAALVKRLVGERGVAPVARMLGCARNTIEDIVTGGTFRRNTVERISAAIEEKFPAGASRAA